ncbi:MAG TPA: von Willebrand factor type A domain-containing protein [Phnomibacter sp.]|nr:von Willebrand factor type A domain-containing protein [Phnomibacter sp.]
MTNHSKAMNNPDKFFEQFKQAASRSEQHRFPGFDEVWQQVETRLDKEGDKKVVAFYRKPWFAIAASLLAMVLISVTLYNNRNTKNEGYVKRTAPAATTAPATPATIDQPSSDSPKIAVVKTTPPIHNVQKKATAQTISIPAKPNDSSAIAAVRAIIVKGVVTDTLGKPLHGASVVVKGTNKYVVSDSAGAFTIEAQTGDLLTANFIGYTSSQVQLNADKKVHVALAPATATLNEVVVVGYGTQKKKSLTGSVTSISSRDLQLSSNNSNNFSQALQGRVAGVQVNNQRSRRAKETPQTFGYSAGAPGANQQVDIRVRGLATVSGANQPMYVVNGQVANGNVLQALDASNINKIDILKDASATAIYGSRAQNGVVIITTKNLGKKEQKRLDDFNQNLLNAGITIPNYQTQEEYNPLLENPFTSPQVSPLSTFSIDVDNASYANIRRYINNGDAVPKDAVRIEEMINYFKYQYASPMDDKPFSVLSEYQDAPWNTQHKLLRIALQAKDIPATQLPASNIVFLIDVSGSMSDPNKLPLLKSSFKVLVDQLRSQDKVSIVVYAGAAGLVLPATSGDKKDSIMAALNKLSAGGSTAGGEGIELAYKTAAENFVKDGNNRVVLATDGDFNVGISSEGDLQHLIEEKRKSGIFLTCLGFGMGNYKDNRLELLADKGNGNYAYIDNMQESNRFLGKEFKGTLYAVAKDVKLQIEFNPSQVKSYRLIGYENRLLNDEDFVNDKIDAGEMGAGHTVTALYEIIPAGVESKFAAKVPNMQYSKVVPNGNLGEIATIKFRYKKPDGDSSTEFSRPVLSDLAFKKGPPSEDFRFAAAVAWFGLKLRDSELIPNKNIADIIKLAKNAIRFDPDGYRAEFIRLMETAK